MSSVKVSAHQEFSKVAFGEKHEQHLLITLEGEKMAKGTRKPLRIAVAIDCSGSMANQKIEFAKKSLRKLAEHMTEDDVLGVAGFTDHIFKVVDPERMTPAAKEKAFVEIDKLGAMMNTNLSGGMLEAYDYLKQSIEKGEKGSLGRAFLFTDGLPTAGEMDKGRLVEMAGNKRPENDSLSCFGYGADHDPELLASMAKAGGGNFYFVSNPDQAPAFFGRELGGLLSCVAQGVKVTITMKPDAKIVEVLNDLDVKGDDKGHKAVVTVDDVYSGETRNVLLKVELPEIDKGGHPWKYADIKVSYEDLVSREPREEELSIKVEYVKAADADKDQNKVVLDQIALQKAAKAQVEARALADKGNFSGAQSVLRSVQVFCSSIGSSLGDAIAKDLHENVQSRMNAAKYAEDGAVYLCSNSKGYSRGRSSNVGTSAMFDTEEQKATADAFTKDEHNCIQAPPQVTIGPAAGPAFVPNILPLKIQPTPTTKSGISKNRTRR
jgi:Ca-activated chloride channel family protein